MENASTMQRRKIAVCGRTQTRWVSVLPREASQMPGKTIEDLEKSPAPNVKDVKQR
jgi:hypothetical protein